MTGRNGVQREFFRFDPLGKEHLEHLELWIINDLQIDCESSEISSESARSSALWVRFALSEASARGRKRDEMRTDCEMEESIISGNPTALRTTEQRCPDLEEP